MKNVGTKVLNVISAVNGKVSKSGYNTFQKYNYVMEKDLLDAVREELVKNRLLVTMSVESVSRISDLTTVKTKHTILDCDSGESIEVWSAGEGKDSTKDEIGGDKACPKAITSASKYFWLKFFLLSGNDDPENEVAPKSTNAAKSAPTQGQGFFANRVASATPNLGKPAVAQTMPVKRNDAVKPSFGKSVMKTEQQVVPTESEETNTAPQDPGF